MPDQDALRRLGAQRRATFVLVRRYALRDPDRRTVVSPCLTASMSADPLPTSCAHAGDARRQV